jgi:hypothetical protein
MCSLLNLGYNFLIYLFNINFHAILHPEPYIFFCWGFPVIIYIVLFPRACYMFRQ